MTGYYLGQRVRMTGTVRKYKSYSRTEFVDAPLPSMGPYPRAATVSVGVIVGKRTVQPGHTDHSLDEPAVFVADAGRARPVYLVAFDLHRKPVMCAPEQLAPLKEES